MRFASFSLIILTSNAALASDYGAQIDYDGPYSINYDRVSCEDRSQGNPVYQPLIPEVPKPSLQPMTQSTFSDHLADTYSKLKGECEVTREPTSAEIHSGNYIFILEFDPLTAKTLYHGRQTMCVLTKYVVLTTALTSCEEWETGVSDGKSDVELIVDQRWKIVSTTSTQNPSCRRYWAAPVASSIYQVSNRVRDCKIDCGSECVKFEADEGTLTELKFDNCSHSAAGQNASVLYVPLKTMSVEQKYVTEAAECPYKTLEFVGPDVTNFINVCDPINGDSVANPFAPQAQLIFDDCADRPPFGPNPHVPF